MRPPVPWHRDDPGAGLASPGHSLLRDSLEGFYMSEGEKDTRRPGPQWAIGGISLAPSLAVFVRPHAHLTR